MNRQVASLFLGMGFLALVSLSPSIGAWAQDEGFDIIYEGVVDQGGEQAASSLDLSLYGVGGFSPGGAFWATAGGRAAFEADGLAINVDASYGTNGLEIVAGARTEISGFGVAGDVTWSSSSRPVIDLRAWGTLAAFRLTIGVRLAGTNTAITLGGSTDFEGSGLSANVGLAGGTLAQAAVGANLDLGGLTVSGSAGLAGGELSLGGGAGLQLGPVSLIANAGYSGAVGLNATAGGTVGWDAVELSAIGMFDDTGVGAEVSCSLGLGAMRVSFMGRFTSGGLTAEIGGTIPLGAIVTSVSVAFDDQSGLSWVEARFEMPL